MRIFAYNNITGEPDAPEHATVTITEDEILDRYYPWWSGEMLRLGRSPLITEANCLDDFVIVNWAWEITAPSSIATSPAHACRPPSRR